MAIIIPFPKKPIKSLIIEGGDVTFKFDNLASKGEFVKTLEGMAEKSSEIKQKNYTCGNCAVYPCFRSTYSSQSAGLCFQLTRQCRQECDNYQFRDSPAGGGICRKDNLEVLYNQECHRINK